MLQEIYTLLIFNFIMIYRAHKISVLLKNQKDSILKCFLSSKADVLFL